MEPSIDNKTINDFFDHVAEESKRLIEWIEESRKGLDILIERAWENVSNHIIDEDSASEFEQDARKRIDDLYSVSSAIENIFSETDYRRPKTKDVR